MATATSGYVLLDIFASEILQYCHGAPTILIRNTVKNVIIDFCERSYVLEKNPSTFCLDEDTGTYTLKYPSDRYRVVDVDDCRLGNGDDQSKSIEETTKNELDGSIQNWQRDSGTTPTQYFLTTATNGIRFYPTPSVDSEDEIYIRSRVTMKRDQTEVDEFLYEKWEPVIQAGALAQLLAMPAASWFDKDLARKFHLEYRRGVKNARKTTLTGTGDYPGRVIPQSFVVGGSNSARGRYF